MFQNFPADLLLSLAEEPLTAHFHKWSLSVMVSHLLCSEIHAEFRFTTEVIILVLFLHFRILRRMKS